MEHYYMIMSSEKSLITLLKLQYSTILIFTVIPN